MFRECFLTSLFSFVKSEPEVRVITVDAELNPDVPHQVHEVDDIKAKSEPQLRVLTFSAPQTPAKKVLLGKRSKRRRGDLDYQKDKEFLRLEKRRLELQEQQLRVLQDIQKQMQADSERNHAFQQAFLDVQRQRLQVVKDSAKK